MTPERWEHVTRIFHSAADLPVPERNEYLDRECSNDPSLRKEVESLLRAGSQAGNFISQPIVEGLGSALLNDSSEMLVGRTLGHYRVEARIGSGGMGDVYRAIDNRLNRIVALKTLPEALASDERFLQRFQNEAQAAATLNHPNVGTIHSVESIDGRPVITMEYVDGKNLDELTPRGGLELEVFLDWFVSLADALTHAHDQGIIHRDIKPGNIMITADGTPKILDFGLARIESGAATIEKDRLHITHPGQIIGTPSYMSPEQAEGKAVDQRTDIFSFGVLMYEALTGNKPFTGDSHAEVLSNLLKAEPPVVSDLRADVPEILARLIDRCLSKKRRRRYQSMREVRAVLEVARAVSHDSGSMDTFQRKLLARPTRSPVAILMGAILLALIIISAVLWYQNIYRRQNLLEADDLSVKRLSQSNNVVYAHITPDGRSMVYNSINDLGRRSMSIRLLDERSSLELLPPQEVAYWGGMAISPDSSQIFFITAKWSSPYGTLWRISSLGGQPRKLVDTVNDLGSLSPDGDRVLFVRYGDTIEIRSALAADGSDEQLVYSAEKGSILRDPQYSTDGSRIYFSRVDNVGRNEQWSLVEIPANGGEDRVLIPPQKEKINELTVFSSADALIINQEDAASNLNQLFLVDIATGERSRVTNDLNSYYGVSASADGGAIVAAQRYTNKHVVVGEIAAKASFQKVTPEPSANTQVNWIDNERLIYDALDNNVPHIWTIPADGGTAQLLTPTGSADHSPVASPDGRTIFFVSERTGERKIWRMNVDGSGPAILTKVEGHAFDPRVSADGEYVIFKWLKTGSSTLGKVPANGGDAIEMPLFSNNYWAYSHDGSQVAYVYFDKERSVSRVAVKRVNEAAPYQIIDIDPLNILKWSPDDKGLLYRQREGGEDPFSTVWYWNISSGERSRYYSADPDDIFDIAISPDSRRLATIQGKLVTDAVMLSRTKTK